MTDMPDLTLSVMAYAHDVSVTVNGLDVGVQGGKLEARRLFDADMRDNLPEDWQNCACMRDGANEVVVEYKRLPDTDLSPLTVDVQTTPPEPGSEPLFFFRLEGEGNPDSGRHSDVVKLDFGPTSTAAVTASPAATSDAPSPASPQPAIDPAKQIVSAPKPTGSKQVEPLAYLASYDAVVDKDYAYAFWKETDANKGTWEIRFKGSVTAGGALNPNHPSFRSNMSKAAKAGLDYAVLGFNLTPKESDPRHFETRVHFDADLNPSHIDVRLVTRRADGSPNEPQVARIEWPAD